MVTSNNAQRQNCSATTTGTRRLNGLRRRQGQAMLVGLDMIRSTQAKMLLHVGLGRWDEAEEMAVDLLALQGGRGAQTARLVLCAASLAQRDYQEAVPRLAL